MRVSAPLGLELACSSDRQNTHVDRLQDAGGSSKKKKTSKKEKESGKPEQAAQLASSITWMKHGVVGQ